MMSIARIMENGNSHSRNSSPTIPIMPMVSARPCQKARDVVFQIGRQHVREDRGQEDDIERLVAVGKPIALSGNPPGRVVRAIGDVGPMEVEVRKETI